MNDEIEDQEILSWLEEGFFASLDELIVDTIRDCPRHLRKDFVNALAEHNVLGADTELEKAIFLEKAGF
jgi:hypothetical protein